MLVYEPSDEISSIPLRQSLTIACPSSSSSGDEDSPDYDSSSRDAQSEEDNVARPLADKLSDPKLHSQELTNFGNTTSRLKRMLTQSAPDATLTSPGARSSGFKAAKRTAVVGSDGTKHQLLSFIVRLIIWPGEELVSDSVGPPPKKRIRSTSAGEGSRHLKRSTEGKRRERSTPSEASPLKSYTKRNAKLLKI